MPPNKRTSGPLPNLYRFVAEAIVDAYSNMALMPVPVSRQYQDIYAAMAAVSALRKHDRLAGRRSFEAKKGRKK